MAKGNPAWYESQVIKDLMPLLGGKAIRGISSYFLLSRIYIGKSSYLQVAQYLDAAINKEDRRALIITDSFTKKFVHYIAEYLDLIKFDYKVWSGVLPEVPLQTIEEGAKICEDYKPIILIAIGGGSVMDTTKMVMVKYEQPKTNIFMILPTLQVLGLRKKIKHWIALPTTSGTGSEAAQAALITDTTRDPPKKIEVVNDELLADITILDVDLVKDLPPFLTKGTGLDALAHSIGGFTTNWGNPYYDTINKTVIKEIIKYLPRAYKYGRNDSEARLHMHMASTWAAFGAIGNSTPGLNHGFGHSFGKIFNIHHGISVAMFLPYTIAFKAKITDKWKELCPLFGVKTENKDRDLLLKEFVQALKNFILSVDGPTCVKEITGPIIDRYEYFEKLDILVDYAVNDAVNLTAYRPINEDFYRKIFEYAWDGKFIDF